MPDGSFRLYGGKGDSITTAAAADPTSPKNYTSFEEVGVKPAAWSLTAALTPGGRHVRLYLETEGRIKTMISEKDNFVKFHSEGSISFLTPTAQRLSPFPVRDPNITANDQGVYALTWDNRDPTIGPDSPDDATAVSPNFGLAFSVDGLEWTVYSNEMTIDGLQRTISTSGTHCSKVATGEVRHVVPVFVTSEQLRLYFSNNIVNIGGGSCIAPASCSLGTAISN